MNMGTQVHGYPLIQQKNSATRLTKDHAFSREDPAANKPFLSVLCVFAVQQTFISETSPG